MLKIIILMPFGDACMVFHCRRSECGIWEKLRVLLGKAQHDGRPKSDLFLSPSCMH